MRVNGSCWLKGDKEGDDSSTPRQYICCILNIASGGSAAKEPVDAKKKIRRRYSAQSISVAKRLSIAQVLLGALVILCQLPPFYWEIEMQTNKDVPIYPLQSDTFLPGVWSGAVMLATGIVGIVGAKKNVRCLIIAHLVMNAFAIMFAISVVAMTCINIYTLADCKIDGRWVNVRYRQYSRNDDYYYNYYSTTTTTPAPQVYYYLLGEKLLASQDTRFYCTNPLFTAWMVLEFVMMAGALAVLGLTIHLLVKNSRALCGCCRTCCSLEEDKDDADELLIEA